MPVTPDAKIDTSSFYPVVILIQTSGNFYNNSATSLSKEEKHQGQHSKHPFLVSPMKRAKGWHN